MNKRLAGIGNSRRSKKANQPFFHRDRGLKLRLSYSTWGLMSEHSRRSLVCFRVLAVGHGVIGTIPLLFHLLLGGFLLGRAQMLPGSGITLGWLLHSMLSLLLPVVWAVWFGVLAWWLWRPTPRLLAPLLWTHMLALVPGSLLCVWGFYALGAAARSTRAGGGLLSPVAVIPLFLGAPLVALALCSLVAARRLACVR